METEADPSWMQRVANEMRHAETAFVRRLDTGFELRWFTPSVEVDLCGHATLAAAHVLWETGRLGVEQIARFHSKSGVLTASKGEKIRLDFPAEKATPAELPHAVHGIRPTWTGKNRMDWLIEVGSEEEIKGFVPNFANIGALGMRGLQVTAKGHGEFDFISRFFAPQSGVPEDPVTGSAHCCLGPYWAERLGKDRLTAFQASERGGIVAVEVLGERVHLLGDAVTVLEGTLRC